VDVMETWNASGENHSCLHWGGYGGTAEEREKHRVKRTRVYGIEEAHEYGFAWEQGERREEEGGRLVWYVDGRPVMKAERPRGTRRLEEWRVLLNVALGGNVCDGKVPADGAYEMVVEKLVMSESPPGGWEKFEQDWKRAPEGKPL